MEKRDSDTPGPRLAFGLEQCQMITPVIIIITTMGRCELEPTNVEAGLCLYGATHTSHLILTNTSRSRAEWQFMSLPGVMFGDPTERVSRPTPRWASVKPHRVGPPGIFSLLSLHSACRMLAVVI